MDKTPELEITQERGHLSHSTYFVLTAKFGEETVSLRLSDNDYSRMFGGGNDYNASAAQKWFENLMFRLTKAADCGIMDHRKG